MNIKETAFHKYLSTIGPQACFAHILECIQHGGEDNMVWELFDEYEAMYSDYIGSAIEITNAIYRPMGLELRKI